MVALLSLQIHVRSNSICSPFASPSFILCPVGEGLQCFLDMRQKRRDFSRIRQLPGSPLTSVVSGKLEPLRRMDCDRSEGREDCSCVCLAWQVGRSTLLAGWNQVRSGAELSAREQTSSDTVAGPRGYPLSRLFLTSLNERL